MEQTLVLLKPDAVQRGLIGRILARFEERGFQIVALKLIQMPEAAIREHYAVHKGKPFYEKLVRFMSGHPIVALVLRGRNAIEVVRRMVGKTFAPQAEPGTIRGDFALSNTFNLIHGADSPESAAREIALFFQPGEIVEYEPSAIEWVYDFSGGEPE